MKKLSILIPVYNEQNTIYDLLVKVNEVQLINGIEKELIVINDFSTDNSAIEINRFIADFPETIHFIQHEINQGKGGAIHTGIARATGEYCIIQDADLELNPEEYNILIEPILSLKADIVYGSRFLTQGETNVNAISKLANGFLTWLSNFVFKTKITDMETCYKLVPTDLFKRLILVEKRFGFEPEITAKLAKVKGLKWQEIAITYTPRSSEQGKKIGWKDGLRAIYCILKYGWFTSKKSAIKS